MRSLSPFVCSAVALLLLASCASPPGEYPSLAKRPVERAAERISGTADVVEPQPAPPMREPQPDAGLTAQLTELVGQAQEDHARFSRIRERTERIVTGAGNASLGSESWAVANVALTELETARNRTSVTLAELDKLYAGERIANYQEITSNAAAIGEARDRVSAWVSEESRVITDLQMRLGG